METKSAVVIALIGIILGGGGVGALLPLFRYRTDRDSVIAEGAESAVQSLTIALQRSDLRVTHLEDENHKLRTKVEELKTTIEATQAKMQTLTNDLLDTKLKLEKMMKEM